MKDNNPQRLPPVWAAEEALFVRTLRRCKSRRDGFIALSAPECAGSQMSRASEPIEAAP